MLPEERFWGKVHKTDNCWFWIGCKNRDGYGKIGVSGRTFRAHVYSWMLRNGHLPSGQQVLHSCDTPLCVRPDHLFLGNNSDNSKDRARKGILNGLGVRAFNEKCIHGHSLAPDNVYIKANGTRQCKPCTAERKKGRK